MFVLMGKIFLQARKIFPTKTNKVSDLWLIVNGKWEKEK